MSKNSKATPVVVILLMIVLAALTVLGIYYYSLKKKSVITNVPGTSNNGVIDPAVESGKVIRDATDKTFQELKEEYSTVVTNPNISDIKMREEFDKVVKNTDPENYKIFYDGSSLDPANVVIFQGDHVTWKNTSSAGFEVVGKDDWGSRVEVPAGTDFTQKFDFIGDYEFSLISGDSVLVSGTITVKSAK